MSALTAEAMRSNRSTSQRAPRGGRSPATAAWTMLLSMLASTSALPIPRALAQVPIAPTQRPITQPPGPQTQAAHPEAPLTAEEQVKATLSAAAKDASADSSGVGWFLSGCTLGVLGVYIARVNEPAPPPARLLGKPPGLALIYTAEYFARGTEAQTTMAIIGCIPNTIALGVALYYFFKALEGLGGLGTI